MGANHRISQNQLFKLITVPAANVTDGVFPGSTTYIDVREYERFAFLIACGATDDTAITAQVKQATAAAGTGSKNVTGAALTGTALAGTNDNKWSMIEVDQRKLDIANNFQYVALDVAATGGTASALCVFFIGYRAQTVPITQGSDNAELVAVDG